MIHGIADTKCKHMALAISMLSNIFLMYTKIQNYPLKYPMYYIIYHNVNQLLLHKFTYVNE